MGRELTHAEVRELLGVYAIDATDDDEAAIVEGHLDDCAPCRAEVMEHREVVSLMAAGWVPAPDGVWDRIASSLEEAPPAMRPPVALGGARERRRERRSGPVRALAAVGVAAAVGLMSLMVVKVLDTSDRVGELAGAVDVERAADNAARQADARKVVLTSADGQHSAEAVVLPDGTGYLRKTNLPKLTSDKTYQLWAVVGTSKISVGVLGDSPGTVAFRAAGNISALAITEEVAGGVVASVKQPTVVGALT